MQNNFNSNSSFDEKLGACRGTPQLFNEARIVYTHPSSSSINAVWKTV
ncbi:hypothetical protein [Herbaspirillum sp. ST 5-3]|nr:hypothetical protein [Herbaspirillum sp. ST 5-3]